MKLMFSEFRGVAPKFDKEQLADGFSVTSVNTRAGRGILEPYRAPQPLTVANAANPASIFKYRNEWFSWDVLTHAVKVPLTNDPYDYAVIASASTEPQMTTNEIAEVSTPYPTATIPLGVPVPKAPTVGNAEDQQDWLDNLPDPEPQPDEYDTISTAYAICYVDAYGRLSAVSEISEQVAIKEYETRNTQQVLVSMPSLPTELQLTNATRGTTARIRLYRTNFDGSEAILQFVAELDYTATEYLDTMYSGDLGDVPLNESWNPPPNLDTSLFPNGPMRKVCVMGSNLIVGHNDKIVCFAEPDAFYAFPPEYYQVMRERIVTIAPMGPNLVVLTDMYPYIVQGSHPASMEPIRLSDPVPCVSEQGVTEVSGSLFYVGAEGMWQVNGYSLTNVTRNFMSRREWELLDPASIKLANYDGAVFIFSEATGSGYVFDPNMPDDALREIALDPVAVAQEDKTNDLIIVERDSNVISEFDGQLSRFMPMQWESKTYSFNAPLVFPMMKVKANQYPVTVTVECDKVDGSGTYQATRTAFDGRFIYLPFQNRARDWRCRVSAATDTQVIEVRSIELAQAPSEFF